MRAIELADNGIAALRLAAIMAGGAALWLVWLVRSAAGDLAELLRKGARSLNHALLRRDRRQGERAISGSLTELERLRQNGAI